MAEASIDIRVFPNKEMFSVDFAELMDAAIPNTGVIQGCEVTLVNGVLNISSGRLVVKGRLGVVTGGTIPNPTNLTTRQNCWLIAVCDLSNSERPFYFMLATADDLDRLGVVGEEDPDFNVINGIEAATLGACEFDPATGLVSDYSTLLQGTPRKGWDWYNSLYDEIVRVDQYYSDKLTWKMASQTDYDDALYHEVPSGAKEIYVVIWIRWVSTGSATQKTSIGFHIPISDYLFVSSAELVGHVNHWTKTNDGFVRLRFSKVDGKYLVKIYNVYQGDTDVTANTYWNILYR